MLVGRGLVCIDAFCQKFRKQPNIKFSVEKLIIIRTSNCFVFQLALVLQTTYTKQP
jgi:hypothetical protein